ncbi:hypothetical protein C0585_07755 [Candidatus Woesearchaeota archaeon]|nr:MAG: hypothetical protein C0585_07755 [Candidatus Woesearchaeota archaeon]
MNKKILFPLSITFLLFIIFYNISASAVEHNLLNAVKFIADKEPYFFEEKKFNKEKYNILDQNEILMIAKLDEWHLASFGYQAASSITQYCNGNEGNIASAIEMLDMQTDIPVKFGKITDPRLNEYLAFGKFPKCPSGGIYSYTEKDGVVCSIHGNRKNPKYEEEKNGLIMASLAWYIKTEDDYKKIEDLYKKSKKELTMMINSKKLPKFLAGNNVKSEYEVSFPSKEIKEKYKDNSFKAVIDNKAVIFSEYKLEKGSLIFSVRTNFIGQEKDGYVLFILSFSKNV